MKTKYKVTSLLIILLYSCTAYGQLSESYFNDTEIKTGGMVKAFIKGEDYIIYGGRSFDQYKAHPSVTKIDTLGNVIWAIKDDVYDRGLGHQCAFVLSQVNPIWIGRRRGGSDGDR